MYHKKTQYVECGEASFQAFQQPVLGIMNAVLLALNSASPLALYMFLRICDIFVIKVSIHTVSRVSRVASFVGLGLGFKVKVGVRVRVR